MGDDHGCGAGCVSGETAPGVSAGRGWTLVGRDAAVRRVSRETTPALLRGACRHTCAVPPVAPCVAAGFVAGCARRHVTPSVSTKRPAQATDAVRVRSVRAEGCVGAAKVAPLDRIRCAEMREPVDRAVGRHGGPTAQCVQLRAAAFRVDGRHPCPCMASLASVARGLPPFHVKQAPVSRRGSEAAARGRSVRRVAIASAASHVDQTAKRWPGEPGSCRTGACLRP